MLFNFNVEVIVEAETPADAYTIMCDTLGRRAVEAGDLEYTTVSWGSEADGFKDQHPAETLFDNLSMPEVLRILETTDRLRKEGAK